MHVTRFLHSLIGRVLLFSIVMACAAPVVAGQGTAEEPKISVLNPTGEAPPIQLRAMASRQASLDGRTIYMVSNTFDNADKLCHSMQAWVAAHMPNVKTEYRVKKGDYVTDDPDLWKEIKANNGVMVMAIGH